MNKPLLIGGFVLLTIVMIITPNALLNYQIQEAKNIVIIKILRLPDCIENNSRHKFLTLEYKGWKIILRTSCKYVRNLNVGQQIKMFHKEGTDNFIFPEENVLFDLIACVISGLISLIIIIIAMRKR